MHCIRLEHRIWLIFPLENLLSIVNGFIRSRPDQMALLIATRLALLSGVLLKSMRLITRRLLLIWLNFLMLVLLFPFLQLTNGHFLRWISKMLFLMVNSQRKSIQSFLLVTLTLRGSLTEYFDNGGHFMVLNNLLEHGLQSSVLLSLSIVFQAVLLIQLFF